MTNLKAIGFTFVGGSGVGLLCLIAFGSAVKRRHPNIAPRSIARPPDTIYNPNPKYKAQERGNPYTGWIIWTLKLSYPTMLRGIPGTGTRARGMEGKLLDVNLDGIVLLRFHAVCLRVALLTTVLALGVVLPLNLTAQCYKQMSLDPTCTDPENENQKLSDYERTTMANIPPLSSTSSYTTDPEERERYLSFTTPHLKFIDTLANAVWGGYPYVHILVRLYSIVLCSWLVFWYTCSTLKKEWKEALALRRVYYLENDLWLRRKRELEETVYNPEEDHSESSSDEDDDAEAGVAGRIKAKVRARHRRRRKREQLRHRQRALKDPWIPPPEQRETVPNIELYSVLVGELPRLPSEVAAGGDTESAIGISRAQAIDWQLAVVSTFFNHCVPNQPGFSSSVAAVTILPDAPSLARAWRMWYTAAAALRRLRFIRTLISERRYYEIRDFSDSDDSDEEDQGVISGHGNVNFGMHLSSVPNVCVDFTVPAVCVDSAANSVSSHNQLNHPGEKHPYMIPPHREPRNSKHIRLSPGKADVSHHEHERHLSNYTEEWWLNNRMSEDGQQFLHTFESKRTSDHILGGNYEQPKEIRKVFGAVNLNSDLRHLPPPMVTGPSSIAPITGMGMITPSNGNMAPRIKTPNAASPSMDPIERAKAALTYYREVFGSDDNYDVESHFFHALQFGPEQTAVYSRELAQGAANCCPNGCGEKRLRDRKKVGIDELIAMEREAVIRVHNANVALQHAQARAAVSVLDSGVSEKDKDKAKIEVDAAASKASAMTRPGSIIEHRAHTASKASSRRSSEEVHDHRRVKSWSPRHNLLVVQECGFSAMGAATMTKTQISENTRGSSASLSRPPSISSGHRSVSAAILTSLSSSILNQSSRGSSEYGDSPPDIMKLPPCLEREAHQLVKDGLRPDPHVNFTPPTSNLRKVFMPSVGAFSPSPPPPPPRSLTAGNSLRSQSVRFLDQVQKATTTKASPVVSAYRRRYFGSLDKDMAVPVRNQTLNLNISCNDQELCAVPSSLSSSLNDLTRQNNEPTSFDASNSTSNQSVPHIHNNASRLRTMTSDSSTSASSIITARNSPSLHASRFGGRMALTSEGKLVRRNNTYQVQGGASVSGNSTVASGPNLDAFDPYSVVKHKKSDGDSVDIIKHSNTNRLSDGESVHDCNRSASTYLSKRKARVLNNNTHQTQGTSYLADFEGLELPDQWAKVEQICSQSTCAVGQAHLSKNPGLSRNAMSMRSGFDNGVWDPQTVAESTKHSLKSMASSCCTNFKSWAKSRTSRVVGEIQSNSTFAVVTFTNRQAAVAARHLLADGRGAKRWQAIEKHPVPPLADSASCDLVTCRGCCRPLTLSISDSQKLIRKIMMYMLLFFIYVFYTLPITFAQSFIKPESLYEIFPVMEEWKDNPIFNQVLSGIVPASLLALFFAFCPLMFKGIANSGSAATSVVDSESAALQYFWWFMMITAFSGSSVMTFVLNTLNEVKIGTTAAEVLLQIAKTVPTQVSATWLNWVILRFTCILPNQYLLQVNTFIFQAIGWNCCARASQGGGPGGCIPYRIYVDSGVVFMCTVSLSFASPLMAPVALAYYLVCAPLFRRNLIYIYRPKYDGGGLRWPFIFDMFISSMVMAQILLTTMMVLKEAIGPCLLAAMPIIPTLLYRTRMKARFGRAYEDAGLLQTSLLDEWDSSLPTSTHQREEFRRFLVDAHKAAYIPVCIAGDATSVLTAEPAVVVPLDHDEVYEEQTSQSNHYMTNEHLVYDESNPHVAQI